MRSRDVMARWLITAVLLTAALVNLYLAFSEGVVWPVACAVVWLGVAAALVAQRSERAADRRETATAARPAPTPTRARPPAHV